MRKGMHGSYTTAAFLLVILVIAVAATILFSLKNVYDNTEESARCATEIRAHAAVVQSSKDMQSLPIVCPTQERIVAEGENPRQAVAQEMKQCWDTWGKGKLRLFGKSEGIYCHVCSIVHLPKGQGLSDMGAYLDSTKVQSEYGRISYAAYLGGVTEGEKFEGKMFENTTSFTYEPDVPIGIMFYYVKGQNFMDKVQNVLFNPQRNAKIGIAIGQGFGIAVGGIPFGAIIGAPVSGFLGFGGALTGFVGREPLDYMSMTLARSLTTDDIAMLGCTYAPVANS